MLLKAIVRPDDEQGQQVDKMVERINAAGAHQPVE